VGLVKWYFGIVSGISGAPYGPVAALDSHVRRLYGRAETLKRSSILFGTFYAPVQAAVRVPDVRKEPQMPARLSATSRLLVLVAVLSVVCCGALTSAAGSRPTAKPTLRIATPDSITPTPIDWADGLLTTNLVYEFPLHWNPDGSVGLRMATSWQWVKGKAGSLRANKDIEFTLRHDARFSDGTLVTAKAVKEWFDYLNSYYIKQYGPGYGETVTWNVPVQSVQTVGKWTVIVHLKSPAPVTPSHNLAWVANSVVGHPVNPKCIANPDLGKTESCGAGPYMVDFADTVTGDHVTLVPNPYYYDKSKQYWGKIYIKTVPLASSRLQALQAGQFDFVVGDSTTVKAAQASGFRVISGVSGNPVLVPSFKNEPAFRDVRVRQALNYAIDRNALVKAFAQGYGRPTSAFASLDGLTEQARNYYAYNPAKAKALLAAAGHSGDLKLTLYSFDGFGSIGTPMMQAVAKYWQAVGIDVTVVPATDISQWASDVAKYDVFQCPCGEDPLWIGYALFMRPGGAFNGSYAGGGWNDPVINKLFLKGQRAADGTKYWNAITLQATKMAYWIPVINPAVFYYANKSVAGGAVGARGQFFADELRPASGG
jgi:peptide/nickel transport system substrate-binding protein